MNVTLSLTQEHYLETIFELCFTHEHKHAHSKDIAKKLNISMASVTEAMANLSAQNFINYQARKPITLTQKGAKLAKRLNNRHLILENFFSLIGCDKENARKTACKVEHNIDDNISKLIDELNKKLINHLIE